MQPPHILPPSLSLGGHSGAASLNATVFHTCLLSCKTTGYQLSNQAERTGANHIDELCLRPMLRPRQTPLPKPTSSKAQLTQPAGHIRSHANRGQAFLINAVPNDRLAGSDCKAHAARLWISLRDPAAIGNGRTMFSNARACLANTMFTFSSCSLSVPASRETSSDRFETTKHTIWQYFHCTCKSSWAKLARAFGNPQLRPPTWKRNRCCGEAAIPVDQSAPQH